MSLPLDDVDNTLIIHYSILKPNYGLSFTAHYSQNVSRILWGYMGESYTRLLEVSKSYYCLQKLEMIGCFSFCEHAHALAIVATPFNLLSYLWIEGYGGNVEMPLFQDEELSTLAATINKNLNYLKDFYNLEDKVGLHGVDSDISHVVWVQCLLAYKFHNKGTIDNKKVIEVEMIERIRHKIFASKLGFIAALHLIVKWLQGALRHTRTAIKLAQGQMQYVSVWNSLGSVHCVIDMNYLWYLMFPYMNRVDKVVQFLIWKNKQFQFHFQIYWFPISLIKHMKRNKSTSCPNAITSMLHEISKGVDPSKPIELIYEVLERVHILFKLVCSAASYCFTSNSMEKEAIMFLIKATTNDLTIDNFVFNVTMTGLVIKIDLKEQCELIEIFSNYKQEVKLCLFAYLALVVAWFKNEHNKVCDLLHDMDHFYLMIIRRYSQGFATFWDLVTSLVIVLKQKGIAGELQQICSTILRVVYSRANYRDCVNIMQQPLFIQQQLISTCSVRIGNKQQWDPGIRLDTTKVQTCQFKHWDPGKHIFMNSIYNLEDKVDLEGVGNDRIMEAKRIMIH